MIEMFVGWKVVAAILAVLLLLWVPLNPFLADAAMDLQIQADHIFWVDNNWGSDEAAVERAIAAQIPAFAEAQLLKDLDLEDEFAEEMLELLLAAEIVKNSPDGVYYSYEQMVESGAAFSPLKPSRCPNLPNFFVTGGNCITIFGNGLCWLFDADVNTSAKGLINVKVLYIEGHILFPDNAVYQGIPKTGSYVDIGPFGTRNEDKSALKSALESLGMTSIPDGYVAHHSSLINGHIVYVLREVHQKFAHNGGHYAWGCDD